MAILSLSATIHHWNMCIHYDTIVDLTIIVKILNKSLMMKIENSTTKKTDETWTYS